MAEISPTVLGFTVDAETSSAITLTLDKTAVGLDGIATLNADQLLVALNQKALSTFTETNRQNNSDQSVVVQYSGFQIFQGSDSTYGRHAWTTLAYSPYTVPTVDPSTY